MQAEIRETIENLSLYWPKDGSGLTTCIRCRRWVPPEQTYMVVTRIKREKRVVSQRVGKVCRYCIEVITAGGRIE